MGEQRQTDITAEMVNAAMKKAVEAGILPRRSYEEDHASQAEIMYRILQAALATREPPGTGPGRA
ncbi:MAG TPA: hypothetical protein VIM12_12005 [Noviherbaspirillum sp.]|jgi:hypothetical protein|uniref:hypothetical protein n=1 Tax=Noviherbaspirillum sp. TaxID=1926288 RepID=UPI002F955336